MRKLSVLIQFLLLFVSANGFAANRYWIASGPSNWNNTANWSNTSGGAGGQSVPIAADIVYFTNLGAGNCNIDIPVVIDGINTSGYIGVIDLANFTFNPSSSGTVSSNFNGGTITANAGNVLSFTNNAAVTFSGSSLIDVELDFTAGSVNLSGATFNFPVTINSLGTSVSSGFGGNIFNSSFEISVFGTTFFQMGLSNPDVFNGEATFLNRGAGKIRIALNSAGNLFNDNIIVGSDAGGGVTFGENTGTSVLALLKTIIIDPLGFSTGQLLLQNLTQLGATPQSLSLTGSGYLYSQNSDWGGNVTFIAPSIRTDNSTYSGTSYIEKTGPGTDASAGNNTFIGDCILSHTSSSTFSMGNVFGDDFVGNLTIENSGLSYITIAGNSAFNTIGGNLVINFATTSISGSSGVYVCGGSTSNLHVSGNVILNSTSSALIAFVHLCYNGTLSIGGDLNINNSSNCSTADINLGFFPTSNVTVNGATQITQLAAGNNNRINMGVYGDCTFNGPINVECSSTATNGEVRFHHGVTSNNIYNGNIFVNNSGASSDGVRFGVSNGQGTMTPGYKLAIGGIGYLNSFLEVANFHQVGAGTSQNILMTTPNTWIYFTNCSWEGQFDYLGNSVFVNGCTFNGITNFEKESGLSCTNSGGNTFNAPVTIHNSSSNNFTLDDTNPNDYNSDVTIVNTGSSTILPSYQCASTYGGDITIQTNYPAVLASTISAKIIMDGNGPQSINTVPGTPKPNFINLQTNNAVDEITLNTPIILNKNLELTQGNLISTVTNNISMSIGSVVIDVSDGAYVDGPVVKTGTSAFTFPVGNAGAYRPIEISASAGVQIFEAQYFGNDVIIDGIPDLPVASTLDHVSDCEYWVLNRQFGSNPVSVKLHYKDWSTNNCSGVLVPTALRVAKWDGSSWLDLGNGGLFGSATTGWVQSGSTINNFSPFTLSSTIQGNPLPIELLDFTAEPEGENVRLNWSTASEFNNDYFEIERSADGLNFETILSQLGAGNNNSIIDYTDLDRNPLNGLSYYRLKQVDFDGQVSYSNIISVTFDNQIGSNLIIYPNPSIKQIVVSGELASSASILITDLLGKSVTTSTKTIDVQENSTTIDISELPSGIYLVHTLDQTVRFIKL